MPPRISKADQRLIAAYTEAAVRIERLIRTVGPEERARLLSVVEPILAELEAMTRGYLQADLPVQFKAGSAEAIARLKRMGGITDIDATFSALHKEALQKIADDAAQSFGKGIAGIRQNITRLISTREKDRIVGEILASQIEGSGKAVSRVADAFRDEGILAVEAGGRRLSIEHYASVVTNTIVAEAHNTGAATRYAANGVQYVRIIERAEAPDKLCQWMKDKVVNIADRRLLNPFHPNCFGSFTPVLGKPAEAFDSLDDPRIPQYVRDALSRKV